MTLKKKVRTVEVSEVQIVPVKPANGLVGFASCVVDKGLFLGSIGVHRRLDCSGYRLTYPTKKVGTHQLNYFYPVTKEAGKRLNRRFTTSATSYLKKVMSVMVDTVKLLIMVQNPLIFDGSRFAPITLEQLVNSSGGSDVPKSVPHLCKDGHVYATLDHV